MANGVVAQAAPNFYEQKGRYSGVWSWLLTTDHKKIGLMYLAAMMIFFVAGMALGVLMRLEMIAPGKQLLTPEQYNAVFTLHGVIMVFLFVIPGLAASFGNFFLPLQIGAEDVAFPKLNLFSWYLFIGGGIMALSSLFLGGGPPDTGWTFYAPYSIKTGTSVVVPTLSVFILGFSSVLTGLNFITTVHRMRAKGMSWFRMPLFSWSLYATAWIQVLATPVVGINLVLIILERTLGIGVFDPAKGGDPILYQHLFWIYSHPAVYIMILPAMGVISEMVSTYSGRTIFGYMFIAFASIGIASVGSLVWGHHMFTSGESDLANVIFSLLTMLVAIPSAVKVFNWIATLYKGSIRPEAGLLYSLSFIFLFAIGGFTGMLLGVLSVDVHLHDTYFIVAHFHYVIFGGFGMAFFGALHHWFPKMFGKMYNRKVAVWAWALIFVGFNVLYFPMFVIGWFGMPRRYYDYLPEYHLGHVLSTIGSWILVFGVMLMLINLLRGLKNGPPAGRNPWGSPTLEWQTASPPPTLNFDEEVVVTKDPYDFQGVKAD